jgi:hypothetical protein
MVRTVRHTDGKIYIIKVTYDPDTGAEQVGTWIEIDSPEKLINEAAEIDKQADAVRAQAVTLASVLEEVVPKATVEYEIVPATIRPKVEAK